jgi:hypothetical protein
MDAGEIRVARKTDGKVYTVAGASSGTTTPLTGTEAWNAFKLSWVYEVWAKPDSSYVYFSTEDEVYRVKPGQGNIEIVYQRASGTAKGFSFDAQDNLYVCDNSKIFMLAAGGSPTSATLVAGIGAPSWPYPATAPGPQPALSATFDCNEIAASQTNRDVYIMDDNSNYGIYVLKQY